MTAPERLSLDYNTIDDKWKVLDKEGFCFGDGKTVKEAVQSARVVTNQDIEFNNILYVNESSSDGLIKDIFEVIDELSKVAGMKVTRHFNNNDEFLGYKMEAME